MSDVLLFNTDNGGEISIVNGVVEVGNGLTSGVFLSLFGGNIQDDGSANNPHQWWGNYDEPDISRKQRSRFQHMIQDLPATPNNLLVIKEAAEADLKWMLNESVATSITVVVTMPGLNRISVKITVIADDDEQTIVYSANWQGGNIA